MINYIKTNITKIENDYIEMEKEHYGYKFIIINTKLNTFKLGYQIVYIHKVINEFEEVYYGFKNENERDLFKNLMNIKSIGVKTSSLIMSTFSFNEVIEIVENNDLESLASIKGISINLTTSIIKTLSKIYFDKKISTKKDVVITSLNKLGYQTRKIYKIVSELDNKIGQEEMVRLTLERISYEQ
ncbi:Holliday junction branch migration protein RuvA [Mesoplasma photuris]|uniref:Holliday junction branch migration protein RuvA n=1 Tax=Mesoplasma photuris TaxID=217731 RepID=UPI0004E0F772|nr:Holliday junction branch migration protein RuvA [Mesoplasma photuris]